MSRDLRKNKWLRYSFMAEDESLKPYLPETKLFSRRSLRKMMDRHKQVILKPVFGRRGFGVILVSPSKNNHYKIHTENKKKKIRGFKKTYRHLKRFIGSRHYMVQQWVRLAKIRNRPFDIRVIVQRKKNSDSWRVTGKVTKVAGKGYIVTNNKRSKGSLLKVETAIQKSCLKRFSESDILSGIKKAALLTAESLTHWYPRHRTYGLDMGVDRKGRIWIIEANRYPMTSHFRKLEDQTMYRRIMRYKKGE